MNTKLSPSYQPAGKSPQSVFSDPPQPTKSTTTDFSNLHLFSIFPQKRETETQTENDKVTEDVHTL